MEAQKYKRVLIKISGEALAGDKHFGLNFDVIGPVCDVIKKCSEEGCEIGIVVGGGNFWRGDDGRRRRMPARAQRQKEREQQREDEQNFYNAAFGALGGDDEHEATTPFR